MVHIVSVIPVSGGWAVTTRSLAGPMVFFSGAKAEAAARRLAETIARRGGDGRNPHLSARRKPRRTVRLRPDGRPADGELTEPIVSG